MTSALLKPCPFCGGEAELDEHQEYRNISTGALESAIAVYCATCGAQHSICRGDIPDIQPAEVIEMWNRRSTVIPAEIAGVVRDLRKMAETETTPSRINIAHEAATLIERLAASQAETRRLALEEAAKVALAFERDWDTSVPWREQLAAFIRALIDQPSTEGGKDGE